MNQANKIYQRWFNGGKTSTKLDQPKISVDTTARLCLGNDPTPSPITAQLCELSLHTIEGDGKLLVVEKPAIYTNLHRFSRIILPDKHGGHSAPAAVFAE